MRDTHSHQHTGPTGLGGGGGKLQAAAASVKPPKKDKRVLATM